MILVFDIVGLFAAALTAERGVWRPVEGQTLTLLLPSVLLVLTLASRCPNAIVSPTLKVARKSQLIPIIFAPLLYGCSHQKSYHTPPPNFPLVAILETQGIIVDLEYKRSTNITGRRLYPAPMKAFVLPEVARALEKAARLLAPQGYGLVVLDAWRPPVATAYLWNASLERGYRDLFAPPSTSLHPRGAAVDVTLYELRPPHRRLDMPTPFDHPYPNQTPPALEKRNARILAEAMRRAGFSPHKSEWWHFDYEPSALNQIVQNPWEKGGKIYRSGAVISPRHPEYTSQ
jgi:D-alanyl-D-alanine dipeptidase